MASKVIQLTSTWPGFSELSYLIIFGDSFSSVGCELVLDEHAPTAIQPLGVPFPGSTWNEEGLPNWVGHLITKYFPRSRFIPGSREQDRAYLSRPLLVYDYAKGGDTILGVQRQIGDWFLPHVGRSPERVTNRSLFVTWIGINDCAYTRDHAENMLRLFALQERLYDAGARNFLFVDVPPIHRSPAFRAARSQPDGNSVSFDNFNNELELSINAFAMRHREITVMMFSSSATFNRLLDTPEEHGFQLSDRRRAGGRIWNDMLHPTSRVHDIVAKDMAEFLQTVKV